MDTATAEDKKIAKKKAAEQAPPLAVVDYDVYQAQSAAEPGAEIREIPMATATMPADLTALQGQMRDLTRSFQESMIIANATAQRLDLLQEELARHINAAPVATLTEAKPSGLASTMVGGMFNCPECGLRIIGPSLTAIQGSKGASYEHPFEDAPKLAGQKCRLIGVKFKPPIVYLEYVNPPKLD